MSSDGILIFHEWQKLRRWFIKMVFVPILKVLIPTEIEKITGILISRALIDTKFKKLQKKLIKISYIKMVHRDALQL